MNRRQQLLRATLALAAGLTLLLPAQRAAAHWCNNIWAAPSRVVVKPEVTTLYVGGSPTQLRVYGVHADTIGSQNSNPMIFEWDVYQCN